MGKVKLQRLQLECNLQIFDIWQKIHITWKQTKIQALNLIWVEKISGQLLTIIKIIAGNILFTNKTELFSLFRI